MINISSANKNYYKEHKGMTDSTMPTGSPSDLAKRFVSMSPVTDADEALELLEESSVVLQNLKTSLGLNKLSKEEQYPLIKNYDKFALLTYVPILAVAGSILVTDLITGMGILGLDSSITPAINALIVLCIPTLDEMVSYRGNPKQRVRYLISRLFGKKARRKLRDSYEEEQQRVASMKMYKLIVSQVKEELHRLDVFTVLNRENIARGNYLRGMDNMGKLVSYYTVEQLEIEL